MGTIGTIGEYRLMRHKKGEAAASVQTRKKFMNLNDNLLKISGGYIYIPKPLQLGDEVTLFVKGTVVKIEQKDLQDGTFDAIHVVKGEIAEKMEDLV